MKKFYFLLLVAFVGMTTNASAQSVQSTTTSMSNSANDTSVLVDCTGGSYYVGYNIISVEWCVDPTTYEAVYPLNNGVTVGYNKMRSLDVSSSLPLYLDYGANISYIYGSYQYIKPTPVYDVNGNIISTNGRFEQESSINLTSINVPFAITTPLQVDNINIYPYCGVNLRLNLFGRSVNKFTARVCDSSGNTTWKQDMGSVGGDIFDLGVDDEFRRFQLGLNLGVNFEYDKYTFGVGLVNDFTSLYSNEKEGEEGVFRAINISVGYKF